jgi:hypothetical protein
VGYLFAFMGIFCLPGFVALGYGLLSARRSMLASTWPTARGVIAKVNLEQSSGGGDGSTVYGVRMRYRYTVDGVAYEGSRIAFGYGSSSGWQSHNDIYEKLENAKSVSVRYDPAKPSVSCLSVGIHHGIRFLLIFSMLWFGFCIGFTCLCYFTSGSDEVLLQSLSVG